MRVTLGFRPPVRALPRWLDEMAGATGASRERVVDFVRAFSIIVVITWHWSLSVVHRGAGGVLVMPNPIPHIPGGWALTWLLQVMPAFFVVGGFANLTAWRSTLRRGGGWPQFYARRTRRLLGPVMAFAVVWAMFEALAHLLVPDYRGVLAYGEIVLIPFWFVAAYLGAVFLVPVTTRFHERGGLRTLALLGAGVALADSSRFGLGIGIGAWVNTGLVWIFAHQLGYVYRDGVPLGWRRSRRIALLLAALVALAGLTRLDAYPRSMVAHEETEISNIFPTTAAVALLAIFQLSVVLLIRPVLERWLRRRRVWKAVIAVNAVIMTAFVWHMTALLLAITVYEGLGFQLLSAPTAGWWAQRPLWLVLPGLFLAVLVALFHRAELRPGG